MILTDEEKKSLATHRLERAYETLLEAKEIITLNLWHAAANRLYYACYYAVYALLINSEITARTHSGVYGMLGLHFVSKGIISKEDNKFYRRLFELRQSGDYDDWFVFDESDIKPLVPQAENFIKTIENLITSK